MIATPRLLLRRFAPDDWQDLHAYLSDPEVVRYEPYAPFTEAQSREEVFRRAADPAFWAVCLRDDGTVIGNLYLAEREFGAWELGYVFNARFQGHGYATESARALLDHAFGALGARRIVANCNPDNGSSWRLLERLGLRREGHLRQNISFKTDATGASVWVDTYEYAMLAWEWKALEPADAQRT